MPVVTVGYDISNAQAALDKFNALLNAQTNGLQNLKAKFVEFNDSGEIVSGTLEKVNSSGQKLVTTVNVLGSALTVTSQKFGQVGTAGAAAGQQILISWQGLLRIFEVQVFRRALNAVLSAFTEGITAASEFQIKLAQVGNLSNQSGAQLQAFSKQVRDLSEAFGIPQLDVLRAGQVALTSQVGDSAKAFNVLNEAIKLSIATGADLQATVRTVTSTLDAFQLSGNQAARVTGVLFSVAQQTRVPLEQLQTIFGRVGIPAQALGISLEDVASSFITFAKQGSRPVEAMALLNTVFSRILSPSRELSEVFKTMGVDSGQLAVKTFGVQGVLQRLGEIAEQQPEKLGELTGSLRALKAFLGLTSDQALILQQNLADIQGNAVNLGAQNTQATGAQQLAQDVQKVKNAFQDLGDSFINGSAIAIKAFGGVSGIFDGLKQGVIFVTAAFAAYRITVLSVAAANAIGATSFKSVGSSVFSAQNAITGFNAVLTAAPAIIIAAALAVQQYRDALLEAEKAASGRQSDLFATRLRDQTRLQNEAATQTQRQFTESFNQQANPIRQAFAAQTAASTISRDRVLEHQRQVTEAFRVQSQTYLDTLRKNVSDTRNAIEQSETDIKTSKKRIQSFDEQAQRRTFESKLGIEQDPFAALALIQNQRTLLRNQIESAFATGDRATIEAARTRLQDLERLTQREQALRVEATRTAAEIVGNGGTVPPQAAQLLSGQNLVPQADSFGRQRIVLQIDANRLERDFADLKELETALEIRLQDLEQQRITRNRGTLATQRAELRAAELAVRDLTSFQALNAQGAFVSPEARRAQLTGGFAAGSAEALRQFDVRSDAILATVTIEGEARTRLEDSIRTLRLRVVDQLAAQERLNADEQRQRNVNAALDLIQTQRQAATDLANEQRDRLSNVRIQAERSLGENTVATFFTQPRDEAFAAAAQAGANRQRALETITPLNIVQPLLRIHASAQAASNALQAEFTEFTGTIGTTFRDFRTRIQTATSPEDIQQLQTDIGAFAQVLRNQGARFEQTINTGALADRLEQTSIQLGEGVTAATQIATANQRIANAQTQLATTLTQASEALPPQFRVIANNIQTGGNAIGNSLDDAARVIRESVQGLRGVAGLDTSGTAVGGEFARGGLVQQFARGGPVRYFGRGGPSGTDTIPAWLSPGEFVVNAGSTRKFYTQLLSMNSGFQPHFASGGLVNNIGDINVNVAGGDTAETTIRQIGRGLEREIRRGNIRLRG